MAEPVALRRVQAIQGRGELPLARVLGKCLRPVAIGSTTAVPYGPTTRRVGPGYRGLCGEPVSVVAEFPAVEKTAAEKKASCPVPDRNGIETVAVGVSEGLRRAPIISAQTPAWEKPGFRGVRYPQSALVVLNTFGNANVRTAQCQRAFAGYLGTTNFSVTAINATVGTPAQLLSFLVPDSYVADELVIACQDIQVPYAVLWTVSLNGKLQVGPFAVIGGRAPLNIQARRDDVVSVDAILRTGDAFAVPVQVLVNGWTFPSVRQADGTYGKVLRFRPDWPREEKRS